MRTKKTVINIIVNWGTQVIKIIAGFVSRTIFIRYLSVEYLGLTSTFSNILQLLSFAELGIGVAIAVEMYKPIAEENYEEQIALFQFYKRVFRVIGLVILLVGGALTPFLGIFVKEMPNIPYVRVVYLLLVINSASSYFMAHKSSYFSVRQQNYVVRIVHSSLYILMLILQSVTLILTSNYLLYFALQVLATLGENIVYGVLLKREYPFLLRAERKKIQQKKKILENIKAVACFKAGNVIVTSTDNLILAKLNGVSAAGVYSNYYMLITAIESVIAQIFSSTVAGIGDLHATAGEQKQKDVFEKMMFLSFYLYALVMTVLLVCLNDFMRIWLGDDYTFSTMTVNMLCGAFFVKGYRNVLGVFREACGLYKYLKFVTLFEAIANFLLSIILARFMGISGIFAGTIVSFLLFGFWKEPSVIYRHVFHASILDYWKKFILYSGSTAVIVVVALLSGSIIQPNNVSALIGKVFLVAVSVSVTFVLCEFWTSEYKFYVDMVRRIFHKRFVKS